LRRKTEVVAGNPAKLDHMFDAENQRLLPPPPPPPTLPGPAAALPNAPSLGNTPTSQQHVGYSAPPAAQQRIPHPSTAGGTPGTSSNRPTVASGVNPATPPPPGGQLLHFEAPGPLPPDPRLFAPKERSKKVADLEKDEILEDLKRVVREVRKLVNERKTASKDRSKVITKEKGILTAKNKRLREGAQEKGWEMPKDEDL